MKIMEPILNGNGHAGRGRKGRWVAFALAVLAVAIFAAYADVSMDTNQPWYGNWGGVVFAVALFSFAVLMLLRPPQRRAWRHLGVTEAYLVALFTEMFGTPLTIYLLGSVLGVHLGFGMLEGHLWAALLARLGLLPLKLGVAIVMAVSTALILLGFTLMAVGWRQTWQAKGELVTDGLYRSVRHPQYAGFLLIIIGFLIQWPTLPTLVLFPILVGAYYRLAQREEAELEQRFGQRWVTYRARTPMLVPGRPTPRTKDGDLSQELESPGAGP